MTAPGGWSLPSLSSRRWRSRRGQITETSGQAWPRLCWVRTCGRTEGPPLAKPALSCEWLDPKSQGSGAQHKSYSFTRAQPFTVCEAVSGTGVGSTVCRARRGVGWACRMSPRQLLIYRGARGGPDEAPALHRTWGSRTRLPTAPFRDTGSGIRPAAWRLSGTLDGPPASRGAPRNPSQGRRQRSHCGLSSELAGHCICSAPHCPPTDSSELASASRRGKTSESSQRDPGGSDSPPAPATAAGPGHLCQEATPPTQSYLLPVIPSERASPGLGVALGSSQMCLISEGSPARPPQVRAAAPAPELPPASSAPCLPVSEQQAQVFKCDPNQSIVFNSMSDRLYRSIIHT